MLKDIIGCHQIFVPPAGICVSAENCECTKYMAALHMLLIFPFGFSDFAPNYYVLVTDAVLGIEFACPFLSNTGIMKTILSLVIIHHVVPLN